MTLNGYFTLNSVFAPVSLASVSANFKNNCVETSNDRPILSAKQIFSRDSSFSQCKVYADIRGDSLKRKH